jgi:hypothetical protein
MTSSNRGAVWVEVVFLSPEEGGRQQPPLLGTSSSYRPHLVLQDRLVRQARLRDGNVVDEPYLGVTFVEGPRDVQFGQPAECCLHVDHHPDADQAELRDGATFTVREGARIVGHGIVLGARR